ncbi:MAG TPA: hypothetical protein VN368_00710 [Candidatus Methylomirabilis sp.]|nr:hypothetical protein [Candidatus Methylomirabilis sp.]
MANGCWNSVIKNSIQILKREEIYGHPSRKPEASRFTQGEYGMFAEEGWQEENL